MESKRRGKKAGSISPTAGHAKGKDGNSCIYTVYDNWTDFPVIIDGKAAECAKVMRMKVETFYSYITRPRKRWHIEKRYLDDEDNEDEEDEDY